MVGIANKYSATRIDNIALLKKNWEKFNFSYLDMLPYNEDYLFNLDNRSRINMNYIPPAMLLYEHYTNSGDNDKAEKIKEFVYKLAKEANQEKDIEQYFKKKK